MNGNQPVPDRIQWHEGMLLSPQHFQQESARVDSLLAWHGLASNPQAWGIRRLEIDENLLATGLLRVLALEAVMPDGMAIHFEPQWADSQDLQLDLLPMAAQLEQEELSVYLTVGRARSMRDPAQLSRFIGLQTAQVEDEVSEALPVDVPRMRANLQLAIGNVPSSLLVHMKLLTVHKDNEVFRRGAFMPATLELSQRDPLVQRVHALTVQTRSKAAFLSKQTAVPSSRIEDRLTALEQRERLGRLACMLPLLEAVSRSPGLQPHQLYLALCAHLGQLALLRAGAVPLLPPAWKHADPMGAFEPILQAMESAVGEVSQEWRTHTFRFDAGAFRLDLQPEWMGARLVLGMRGRGDRELIPWMQTAVIGSQTVWTSLSDRRVLGAVRKPIDDAPELGLRAQSGYTLFSVEPSAEFIVADQPLIVSNANESSQVQRPLELVLFVRGQA
jgi:type VI secretion system protein ImpJ